MPSTQADASALPLPSIVIPNEEIGRRPVRIPDFELESRVLRRLSRTLTVAPDELLQMLVNTLIKVCRAGSAGVSLLEDQDHSRPETHFRWVATAGGLEAFAGHRVQRNFSPCGTTLDVDRTLLMRAPAAHFGYLNQLPIPICEMLLIPFRRDGMAIGAVWVVTHEPERQFDLEDMRLIGSISQFAAAATQVVMKAATSNRAHVAARHAAAVELADLTAEHRKLAQSDREKAELLATVTHEFRNMVAPLATALEIIKRSEERSTRTKAREMMERQVQQMTRLIEDLLDTSRLASGKLRLSLQQIDLGEVLRNAMAVAHNRIEASGQKLATLIPPGHCLIQGDEVRLAQVFANLLTNAAKYGRPGGTVTVTLTAQASEVTVSIKDSGVGIDSNMLPRIFDLFVQIDASLNKSDGGLGIGLALVRHLVELHGGQVEALSEGVDKGSEFVVRLPRDPTFRSSSR